MSRAGRSISSVRTLPFGGLLRHNGAVEIASDPGTALAEGWGALARNDWDDAWRWFQQAEEETDAPEVLEGLSWAAWWRADAEALFDARERAYRGYRAAGRDVDAARMATWLGTDSVDFRGQDAVARGWLGRARSLLEGREDTPEYGWLCVHEAEKLMFMGDTDGAIELAQAAIALSADLDEPDMRFLATATIGLSKIFAGEVTEGSRLLEDVVTAALADEVSQTWVAGWCCCYLYYGCEQMHDYDRASQWCQRIVEWASGRLDAVSHACRAHHASVLTFQGQWAKAEAELMDSREKLVELRPPAAVDATARLGELRRRQGRSDEAAELFDESAGHPIAILGMGELCLERSDPVGARQRAEEYLRDGYSVPVTPRAAGLDLLARAAAAAGDLEKAYRALGELGEVCEQVDTMHGRACHALASGFVAEASGDSDRARIFLEDASRLFRRVGAPWEEARARMQLARVLYDVGRDRDAVRHEEAAARLLDTISLPDGEDDPTDRAPHSNILTSREREVLALVAQGMTNKGVAAELVLSEHTINRHMTNILTKLGTGSRSAAVAEAIRSGLL